jgi:hypothetical protein
VLFDRIGFRVGAGPITYESSIMLNEGHAVFNLGPDGVLVEPGSEVSLELVADIEADTPSDHFVLVMNANTGITLVDATDSSRNPGFTEDEACEVALPLMTDPTRILLPAGSPIVRPSGVAPRLGCPGQKDIVVFESELAYKPPTPKGDVVMLAWRGTVMERAHDGLQPVAAGEIFEAVYLLSEGAVVAVDTVLAGDGVVLEPEAGLMLERGSSRMFRIVCDLAPDATQGNYLI